MTGWSEIYVYRAGKLVYRDLGSRELLERAAIEELGSLDGCSVFIVVA
ncbi:MAG: hypothetical protein RLZZ444_4420 [Pseudomonadota bacterium]|jgi:hypothetical protein